MTKKPLIVFAAVGAAVLLSAGSCSQQQVRDLEDVPAQDPEKTEIYNNVDGYANVVRACIDGVAFAFTTRDYQAITRIPEWDASFCGTQR